MRIVITPTVIIAVLTLAVALICCTVIVTLSVASALATHHQSHHLNTQDDSRSIGLSQTSDSGLQMHPIPAGQRYSEQIGENKSPGDSKKDRQHSTKRMDQTAMDVEPLNKLLHDQKIILRRPYSPLFLHDDDPAIRDVEEEELETLIDEEDLDDTEMSTNDIGEDQNFDRGSSRKKRSLHHNISPQRRETLRDMQRFLRESNEPLDCCPFEEQIIEPEGAKDLDGMYVRLYRDGNTTQRFFENSCRLDIVDKPCRFVHTKLTDQSRCVQKYIWVYAIVQNEHPIRNVAVRKRFDRALARSGVNMEEYKKHQFHNLPGPSDGSGWRLDYIKVRSGCSCQVSAKGKRNLHQQHQQRRAQHHRGYNNN